METKMMISAVISGALGISCNERQSYKWIASLSYWQKKLSTH